MANQVSDGSITYFDYMKMLDPTGEKLMPVVQVLNQINAPLQDGPVTPSNSLLGHRTVVQASLPTTTVGKTNRGIARSKGTTEQHNETMAMFVNRTTQDQKQRHQIGEALFADMQAKQDIPTIESMTQKVAYNFVNGSVAADEGGFDGLGTRMASLNAPAPGTNGSQVWSKGTVVGGDGTSIYIVDWQADRGCHWIYPKESKSGGLVVEDHENVPLNDNDGNQYFAAVTDYYWTIGIAVEDPRRIARLANIDASDANLGGVATQGLLIDSLVDIFSYMPSKLGFNRVMYVHARIWAAWWKQILNKTAPLFITPMEYLGEMMPHFDGVPVRRLDQISLAESTVS